jgi:hypothetical protein
MRKLRVDYDRLTGAMRGHIDEYAKLHNIHRNTVSAKINGTRKGFLVEDLNRFAAFLGRDPLDFLITEAEPFQRANLLTRYPWARNLSAAGQDKLLAELSPAIKTAHQSGDWSAVAHLIEMWRDTAAFLNGEEATTYTADTDDESDGLLGGDSITIEQARAILANISENLSDTVIAEREERF